MAFTKMLWVTENPTVGSWDYWASVSQTIITFAYTSVFKSNNKIAYYAVINLQNTPTTTTNSYIIVSPDADAVKHITYNTEHGSRGTITDRNNITWHWSGGYTDSRAFSPSECLLNDTYYPNTESGFIQACKDLIDRIYAVPFHEDYQSGTQYTFDTFANKAKSLRKIVGVFLFKNISYYGTDNNYTAFSDNIDTIIATLISQVGNDTTCIYQIYWRPSISSTSLILMINHASVTLTDTVDKYSIDGFDFVQLRRYTSTLSTMEYASIYNGQTSIGTDTDSSSHYVYCGVYVSPSWSTDINYHSSNLGVDL